MNKDSSNWAEKYRVNNFSEFKGQEIAVETVKNFLSNFPGRKKAVLLHGPAGTGKTSLAYILKNEFDLELLELNASDFRNKEQLERKLKPATEQSSLFKKSKVLLVDEVDGLSSMKDRGGLTELIGLIENTQFPIVITANSIWDSKFSGLRKKCELIELKDLNYKDVSLILQEIVKKETLDIDNQILTSLAIRCKGDVRAAINDLQTISSGNVSDTYLSLDERNKEIDIFNALKLVFKGMLNDQTLRIYDRVDLPLDKIFLWIEENIPLEYSGEELFKAYEILSLADVFRGRIRRQRYWRFLVYENILLTAGIALSKKSAKTGFTKYRKPTRILKIWMNNQRQKHKKTILMKYAKAVHCSKKKAAKEFYLLKNILKNPNIQKQLDLSDQEIDYIHKMSV